MEGKLRTRSWEDKENHKRYTTEIVVENFQLLDKREQSGTPQANSENKSGSESTSSSETVTEPNFDDDLPF